MHAITCRTPGCHNEGFTFVFARPGHTIICASCTHLITDIDPPLPEGGYPAEEE